MNGKIHGLIDGRINAKIDQLGSLLNQAFDALAPTLLNVTRNISTEIDLEWTVNSTNLEGSRIYRSTDGVTYTELATVAGATAKYIATGLTAGGLYYFKVVSYKGATETDPTNVYDTRLKLTIDTTKAGSAADTFVLPTYGTGYDAYVDWGDGSALQNITGTPGNVSHTYAASGTYQVKVHGTFKQLYFNNEGDKLKLMKIDNWGTIIYSSFLHSFWSCSNMIGNYIDIPNTSNVVSASLAFAGCTNFNSRVNFDTSNILEMDYMFASCPSFKQALSSFNMQKVNKTTLMLNGCNINETGTTTNYDNTLIAWAAQDLVNSLAMNFGTSKYGAGAGAAARQAIIDDDLWTITDGGQL